MVTFKYRAFISYSHKDKKWGDWLHKGLERYRIPKNLIGQETRLGLVPNRIFPVFRDREELPTSSDLSTAIREALENSQSLIVICSRNSARSKWVNEEILAFKRIHGENNILAIIVDGEPHGTDKPGLEDQECFPPALRFKMGKSGKLTKQPTEPIAADARETGDGKDDALLKLIAGVLGVNFNDLKKREVQEAKRRARRSQLVAACMGVLALVAMGTGWFAWEKKDEADHQSRIASIERDKAKDAEKRAVRQSNIAKEREKAAENAKKVADLERDRAESSRKEADKQKNVAVEEKKRAEESNNEAIKQRKEAQRQRLIAEKNAKKIASALKEANLNQSNFLQSKADEALKNSDPETAGYLLRKAGQLVEPLHRSEAWKKDYLRRVRAVNFSDHLDLVFSNHNGRVDEAVFSSNGKIAITASDDNTVRFWNSRTGKEEFVLAGEKEGFEDAKISPNGLYVLTQSSEGVTQIWNSITRKVVRVFSVPKPLNNVARFSSDGRLILLLTKDEDGSSVHVLEIESGRKYPLSGRFSKELEPRHISFSADGQYLAINAPEDNARFWQIASGEELGGPLEPSSQIIRLKFSPKDNTILLARRDGSVRIWDFDTRKDVASFKNQFQEQWASIGFVSKAKFSGDGLLLAVVSGSSTSNVSVREVSTGRLMVELRGHTSNITYLAFSPDNKLLLTSSADGTARLWQVPSGELISTFRGHRNLISVGKFSPNGQKIITASHDGTARIWSLKSRADTNRLIGHQNFLGWAEFDPNSHVIMTTPKQEGQILIWDIETKQQLGKLKAKDVGAAFFQSGFEPINRHIAAVSGGIFEWEPKTLQLWDSKSLEERSFIRFPKVQRVPILSSNNKYVATVDKDGTARIQEVTSGKIILELDEKFGIVEQMWFSAGGKFLVVKLNSNTLKVLDRTSGVEVPILSDLATNAELVRFSPSDSGVVVVRPDKAASAKIWSRRTSTKTTEVGVEGHKIIETAFSPGDERYVMTISENVQPRSTSNWKIPRSVTIWDAMTGIEIMKVTGAITHAKFSPDSKYLLTLEYHKSRIFELSSGDEVALLHLHRDIINDASFSSDGKNIVTASEDLEARVWHLPEVLNKNLVILNEARSTRSPSMEEKKQYFLENSEAFKNTNATPNLCDAIGGLDVDPNRTGPAIEMDKLKEVAKKAVLACKLAAHNFPEKARLRFQLARALEAMGRIEEAQQSYIGLSKGGYAAASLSAAIIYEKRHSMERAHRSFFLAWKQGLLQSADRLALATWNGLGVEQDRSKAIAIWRRAAGQGAPAAHERLGDLYYTGMNDNGHNLIKTNWNMAFKHYSMATYLFEDQKVWERAARNHLKKGSLARILPASDVVKIWKSVRAWKPSKD